MPSCHEFGKKTFFAPYLSGRAREGQAAVNMRRGRREDATRMKGASRKGGEELWHLSSKGPEAAGCKGARQATICDDDTDDIDSLCGAAPASNPSLNIPWARMISSPEKHRGGRGGWREMLHRQGISRAEEPITRTTAYRSGRTKDGSRRGSAAVQKGRSLSAEAANRGGGGVLDQSPKSLSLYSLIVAENASRGRTAHDRSSAVSVLSLEQPGSAHQDIAEENVYEDDVGEALLDKQNKENHELAGKSSRVKSSQGRDIESIQVSAGEEHTADNFKSEGRGTVIEGGGARGHALKEGYAKAGGLGECKSDELKRQRDPTRGEVDSYGLFAAREDGGCSRGKDAKDGQATLILSPSEEEFKAVEEKKSGLPSSKHQSGSRVQEQEEARGLRMGIIMLERELEGLRGKHLATLLQMEEVLQRNAALEAKVESEALDFRTDNAPRGFTLLDTDQQIGNGGGGDGRGRGSGDNDAIVEQLAATNERMQAELRRLGEMDAVFAKNARLEEEVMTLKEDNEAMRQREVELRSANARLQKEAHEARNLRSKVEQLIEANTRIQAELNVQRGKRGCDDWRRDRKVVSLENVVEERDNFMGVGAGLRGLIPLMGFSDSNCSRVVMDNLIGKNTGEVESLDVEMERELLEKVASLDRERSGLASMLESRARIRNMLHSICS